MTYRHRFSCHCTSFLSTRRPTAGPRRGYFLNEMLVVMVAGSVLAGVAVTMIVQVQRVFAAQASNGVRTTAVVEFGRQWRRDVQTATTISLDDNDLVVVSGGANVRYVAADGQLLRVVREGDEVVSSSPVLARLRHERGAGRGWDATWVVEPTLVRADVRWGEDGAVWPIAAACRQNSIVVRTSADGDAGETP